MPAGSPSPTADPTGFPRRAPSPRPHRAAAYSAAVDADPTYDHLSCDPAALDGLVVPDGLTPMPEPHRVDARQVAIVEGGEPLVAVEGIACVNAYRAVGWPGTTDTVWLRAGVVDQLHAVEAVLPDGFTLAIFDGWRSPVTVRALWDHYYGPRSTLEPGFLADPDDTDIIPPHGTGGAVDLTLAWQGVPLSLGTAFDDFSERAHLRAIEDEPGPARELRRLQHWAMVAAGFAPNPMEWWHFSWGDQWWAATTGADHAVHGPVSP